MIETISSDKCMGNCRQALLAAKGVYSSSDKRFIDRGSEKLELHRYFPSSYSLIIAPSDPYERILRVLTSLRNAHVRRFAWWDFDGNMSFECGQQKVFNVFEYYRFKKNAYTIFHCRSGSDRAAS